MPKSWPASSTSLADSRARWLAEPPPRLIGIWPTARKNHAVFGSSKYSALATKVMRRLTISGRKNESNTARWLPARIAPPCVGTCSRPSTLTRQKKRKIGVNRYFTIQYAICPRTLVPGLVHRFLPLRPYAAPVDRARLLARWTSLSQPVLLALALLSIPLAIAELRLLRPLPAGDETIVTMTSTAVWGAFLVDVAVRAVLLPSPLELLRRDK